MNQILHLCLSQWVKDLMIMGGVGKIASEENPKRYIVHSIKNTVIEKNGVLFIQYWLNLKPFEGPRSPAWRDGK